MSDCLKSCPHESYDDDGRCKACGCNSPNPDDYRRIHTGNLCPDCGKNNWKGIPDSLAEYCECGFVRVKEDGYYVRGSSLQQWLNDVYKIPLEVTKGIKF